MSEDLREEEVAEWIRTICYPTLTSRARKRIWREAWRRARSEKPFSLSVPTWRFRPALVALLCTFIFLAGTFGTVLAAQGSMPTDFLYPVKRASEAVWWAVVPASDRPTVALELALRRMEEVEYLLDKGEAVPEELWDDLTERLANVGSMADGQVPEHVRARLEHHLRVLEQQMARHPDNPGLRRAVEASRRALEVLCCPSEETHPPTATPSLTPPGQGGGQGPPSTPPGQGEGQGPSPTPPGRGKK